MRVGLEDTSKLKEIMMEVALDDDQSFPVSIGVDDDEREKPKKRKPTNR